MTQNYRAQGEGYLVYLSDGDVPFFRVSPIFSRMGYQNKAFSSGAGVITCQKGKFCYIYFSPIFSRIGNHLKAKIRDQGREKYLYGHVPVQIQIGQVPPPPRTTETLSVHSSLPK